MDDVTLARALHVLAVVLWIGGMVFVTTVLLPAARDPHAPAERVVFFETVERRFGRQARVTTVLAGLSGFYMVVRLDLWDRFLSVAYLWMHAMVAVWLRFTLMLFVAEPLFLDRWLLARARPGRKRPSAHRAAALDPVGSEPDHLDRRGSRQPRGADHRISAPRTTATARLVFKRIVAPASARSSTRPTRLVCIFLITEGCPLIWINAAVISSGQNSVRKT